MEAVIKFNIIESREEDWMLDDYAQGKLHNLTKEDLTAVIAEIIREAIADNRVYYDLDDAERATQNILPTISSIISNPQFSHITMDYDLLVEMVTYLTIRLA